MSYLKDKFCGALVGTQVGDSLGMPVEGASSFFIKEYYGEIREMLEARSGAGTYTDDTEMAVAVAESLERSRGFDGADMASAFLENFNPERGYGAGTIKALTLIQQGERWDEAGKRIFNGGSYGNGAAMRIAPVGCLYYRDLEKVKEIAQESSRITHAHQLGMEGAAVQACGITLAVSMDPQQELDAEEYISTLLQVPAYNSPFREKLQVVRELLHKDVPVEELLSQLGNDVSSLNSVPTAIYSFLKYNYDFEEALVFAVGLGGDTDTIGAMTGALTGSYRGKSSIPERWLRTVEKGEKGIDYIENLALKLYNLHKELYGETG